MNRLISCGFAAAAIAAFAWTGSAESMSVLTDGGMVPIFLPTVTETERFVAMDDAKAREMQRARFPKATDAELEKINAQTDALIDRYVK
jgi:hypothetical protein